MKLKVTVNGIPYDIEVDVEEQEAPQLGAIVIGGGGTGMATAPTTASVQAASANAVVAPAGRLGARRSWSRRARRSRPARCCSSSRP